MAIKKDQFLDAQPDKKITHKEAIEKLGINKNTVTAMKKRGTLQNNMILAEKIEDFMIKMMSVVESLDWSQVSDRDKAYLGTEIVKEMLKRKKQ